MSKRMVACGKIQNKRNRGVLKFEDRLVVSMSPNEARMISDSYVRMCGQPTAFYTDRNIAKNTSEIRWQPTMLNSVERLLDGS